METFEEVCVLEVKRTPRISGFSLVEVLVVTGIGMIVMTAIVTVLANQGAEVRALSEKLASQDFARTVTAALSNAGNCGSLFAPANLTNPASLNFNPATVSPSNRRYITLRALTRAGTSPLATAGDLASPLSNSLFLNALTDAPTGLQVQVIGATSAELVVTYDQTRLVRALPNLTFPIEIQTTGPAAAKQIVGCSGVGGVVPRGSFIDGAVGSRNFTVPVGVTSITVTIVSGGGGGGSSKAVGAAESAAGAGGNGGAMVKSLLTVMPGDIIPYTIGAGGAGGTGGNDGADGQASSFGSATASYRMFAPGARGGVAAPVAIGAWVYGPQVATRQGTGGNIINGYESQGGGIGAGHCSNIVGGHGGPGPWGGGASSLGTSYPGAGAHYYGGGGGGASSVCPSPALDGGPGKEGLLIVEW